MELHQLLETNFRTFTYPFDYISEVGPEIFKRMCYDVFGNDGFEPATHYFTFLDDDYSANEVILVAFDYIPSQLILTTPIEAFDAAVGRVKAMNPHLQFGEVRKGSYEEDTMKNRQSAKIFFTQREPANGLKQTQ